MEARQGNDAVEAITIPLHSQEGYSIRCREMVKDLERSILLYERQ